MKPKYYFTLGGDLGEHQISEPEGWATIIFNLERDLTYWSLIENFEAPLIFYGIAEGKDGGYNYLSQAKTTGPDTLVTLGIQISLDGGLTRELCFDGRIDVSTAKETIYRAKIEAAIVRNDLWSVFMANKSTPIDIFSTTDIYGNARYPINKQELSMPPQKLIRRYSADMSQTTQAFTSTDSGSISGKNLQVDWDEDTLTEIQTKFSLPIGVNTDIPVGLFSMDEDGDYSFEIRLEASVIEYVLTTDFSLNCQLTALLSTCGTYINNFFVKKNNDPVMGFIKSDTSASTVYDFISDMSLKKGDEIKIYAQLIANMPNDDTHDWSLLIYGKNPSVDVIIRGYGLDGLTCKFNSGVFIDTIDAPSISGLANPSFINITANTTVDASQCDSVLLHDAGLSVCDRILGRDDTFYSEFLGGDKTSIHYGSNGCGYLNALTRGLNIRGYLFSEKPFTLSFDDYWNGINPIFNMGLGYEELGTNSPSSTVIRMENKREFFNDTPSVYLTAINDITNEFDLNLFTKTIEIGFAQWEAESASGIDDPQTSHIYALRYKLFGKDEKQLSKFVAASLAIEQGRRLIKTQSNDWRLDENIFIVALQEQDSAGSSPAFVTEKPEVFATGVTGINNPETRYNVRHTPARLLQRWMDFYSGQLQSYPSDQIKYQSGQGNVNMTWVGDGSCDIGTLTDNQDQIVSSDFIFIPIVYSFVHPLSWEEYSTIRDNRKNAISISWIDPYGDIQVKIAFIKKLSYDINKSKGTFDVWIKDFWSSFDELAFSDAFDI